MFQGKAGPLSVYSVYSVSRYAAVTSDRWGRKK